MIHVRWRRCWRLCGALVIASVLGDPRIMADDVIDDEAQVPAYVLPKLLPDAIGETPTPVHWEERRRELLTLFGAHVYGRVPDELAEVTTTVVQRESGESPWDGVARRQLRVEWRRADQSVTADLLIFLPVHGPSAVPVFLGLNFAGNHAVSDDPEVWLPSGWFPNGRGGTVDDHRATEQGRGTKQNRWPVSEVVSRGYALATLYCGHIDPDVHDGFQNGVHALAGRPHRDGEWGTLAAWAWGLSRTLDILERETSLDGARVAVLGHSRLGKAALWAGAQDERFAMVISNNSGCGGAALSRRRFGETVELITDRFPHWFTGQFRQYAGRESTLPLDQHMLLALVAPRPLYVASAAEDHWADPRGEFLALQAGSLAYQWLGRSALAAAEMPEVDQPLRADVAYHVRSGRHDLTPYDWRQYLDFADRHWPRR